MPGVFTSTKVGRLWACYPEASTNCHGYFPSVLDTTDIVASVSWPWSITALASTIHGIEAPGLSAGISLFGCKTGSDPALVASWETYQTALARNAFDAWEIATGQTAFTPTDNNVIYVDPDTLDAETPCVLKIGSTYYMTYHDVVQVGEQPTRMATATGGPLNFTRISNGLDGKVIDGMTSPNNTYPVGASTLGSARSGHRGYFRWAASPFPEFPYAYVGTALHGGDGSPYAIFGHDSPEDGTPWTYVQTVGTTIDFYTANSASFFCPNFNVAQDAGGGEICVPGTSGQVFHRRNFEPQRTRIGQPVIALGTGSDYDVAIPSAGWVVDPTDPTRYIVIYHSRDSGGEDNIDYHVMLATAEWDASAAKPAAIVFPNHDKYVFDARGASSWPAWLTETVGTSTFNASGVRLGTDATGSIVVGPSFNPATTSWAEIFIKEAAGNSQGGSGNGIMDFVDITTTATPGNQVSVRATGAADMTWLYRKSSTVHVNLEATECPWQRSHNIARKNLHGVRWEIENNICHILSGGRTKSRGSNATRDFSAFADITSTMYPRIRTSGTRTLRIEQIEMRIGTTGAGVRPTISTAEATSTSAVTLTFDKDCIGDCTGITVNDGGAPVAGTWTRPTLGTAVFTRSSGTWSGALTYDISSTDLRSEADLVALADVTGALIVPPEAQHDAPASSRQQGYGAGSRSGAGIRNVGGSV